MNPRRLLSLFVFTLLLLPAFIAPAQEVPDELFNAPPEAFGNHIQDVPPDILSVRTDPVQPAAGQPFSVLAVVRSDPEMTAMRVVRARLTWTADNQAFHQIDMSLSDPQSYTWTAQVPAQPSGTTVRLYIDGEDEIGNAVAQIPFRPENSLDKLWTVVSDPRDESIPGGVDITSLSFATDEKTLWFCQNYAARFISTNFYGATLAGMGIVAEDARIVRYRSTPENNVPYIAYVPFLNRRGLHTFRTLLSGDPIGNARVFQKGKNVCGSVPVSDLTSTPGHGLKIFAATAALKTDTAMVTLFDASPWAILYFKGLSLSIP